MATGGQVETSVFKTVQQSTASGGAGQSSGQSSVFGQSSGQNSVFGQSSRQSSVFGQSSGQSSVFEQSSGQSSVFGQSSGQSSVFGQSSGQSSVFEQSSGKSSVFGQSSGHSSVFGQSSVFGHVEIWHEFNCTPCIVDNLAYTAASHYCRDCDTYFCRQCAEKASCGHRLMNWTETDNWGKSGEESRGDKCARHKGNNLQLYCSKHEAVCCLVCRQQEHRNCGPLQPIAEILDSQDHAANLDAVKHGLNILKVETEETHKNWVSKLETVEKTASKANEPKDKDRTKQDTLAQQPTEANEKMLTELKDRIKCELQIFETGLKELEKHNLKLEKENDQTLLFIKLNQCKQWMDSNRELLQPIKGGFPAEQFDTLAQENTEQTLDRLQHLDISDQDKPTQHRQSKFVQNKTPVEAPVPKANQPYKVQQKSRVSVKIPEDRKPCNIWGMCQLSDGSILLSDYNNKLLKQLDPEYNVVRHCALSGIPLNGLCEINCAEVAVGLDNKTVQFVYVGARLAPTRSISFKHNCTGLAYYNNTLYITALWGPNVYMYDLSGSLLKVISTSQDGQQLFSSPRYIAINPDTQMVYVADVKNGLITLKLSGDHKATLGPAELGVEDISGVGVDGAGNVLVGGFGSDNILHVAEAGDRVVAEIVKPGSEDIGPWALCFDRNRGSLLVSSMMKNQIWVLNLIQDI